MLFRCSKGELIETKRFDYINDKEYYKKIIILKKIICYIIKILKKMKIM